MATCETNGHLYSASTCIMCGVLHSPSDPVLIPLRDQFAMAALQGLLAYSYCSSANGNYHENSGPNQNAIIAYVYADAMLNARRTALTQEASK